MPVVESHSDIVNNSLIFISHVPIITRHHFWVVVWCVYCWVVSIFSMVQIVFLLSIPFQCRCQHNYRRLYLEQYIYLCDVDIILVGRLGLKKTFEILPISTGKEPSPHWTPCLERRSAMAARRSSPVSFRTYHSVVIKPWVVAFMPSSSFLCRQFSWTLQFLQSSDLIRLC